MNEEAPATGTAEETAKTETAAQATAPPTWETLLQRIRDEIEALTAEAVTEAEKEGHAVSIHLNLAIADLEHLLTRDEIVLGLKKA